VPDPASENDGPASAAGASSADAGPRDPALVEQFVQLYALNHRRLFAYIMVLVHDRTAAEEVFQEMSLILWREFPHYRADGDFVRWANAMSFNQVRKWRRNRNRDRLVFGEGLIEDIARDADALQAELDPRRSALTQCLKQMKERDRKIIDLFYGSRTKAELVAEQLGKSVHTIYKALKTIRKALMECIDKRLAAER
jgi:RNA polymerase sigma-70 factor (ECF subfamily)